MTNEEMILRLAMKAYSKGTNLDSYFEDLLEVVKTLCDVAKAARMTHETHTTSSELTFALDRLDALGIE